ncbi:hypothetical protein FRC08_005746 [Ceratobasidium sp. 394]|nr:hypothetical protein FRC08_005746 [Ceratobasidium sp. 394]KAG9098601.1 hypothetical protein FS749_003427 [Ceratobasidium sp. UAMH 11750]
MASQRAVGDKQRFRHRLREIKLEPNKSTHGVAIEIQVDGTSVHKLSEIKRGQLLHWTDQCLPCDIHEDSKITIQVTEIHTFSDRVGRASYQVSQAAGQDTLSIGCDNELFKVNLTFLDQEAARRAYSEAFVKLQRMEENPSLLEKAGKVGDAFKVLLTLGSTLADLDPTGSANIVFSVCTMAWEHLENQEKQNEQLGELVENIASMIPSVESIKDLADTNLKQTVMGMLNLIEDVSVFILSYNSRSAWDQTWRSAFSSAAQEKADGFVGKFRRLRKEFDTRVNVQALRAAEMDRIQAKLRGLKPVELASYDPSRKCIAGTRVEIIDEIVGWALRSDAGPSLAWVQGLAGLGKSSIAASVCQRLDDQRALACSFFCKRDSPELRDPRRALTTIIYGLTHRWEAYGEAVVAAIREDPDLHLRHLQPLYDALVVKPLQALTGAKQPRCALVVVVDALDECGDIATRKQLLTCLKGMSQIIPSLKVVATSRPDADIQEFFGHSGVDWFAEYKVLKYDALADVRVFVQDQLGDIAQAEDWPEDVVEQLSVRSSGLFIWARTACKFILDGLDRRGELEKVLAGTRLSDGLANLDVLYTTAVKARALDGDSSNLEYVLKCLGAIVVTGTRTPLSVSSLSALLGDRVPPKVLDRVVHSLSSVLYVDQKLGGAIRISHPSFMDYIIDPSRSKELCVDLEQQNTILAECCLEMLATCLKFNICGLETSDVLNRDVPNLEIRVREAIGPHLSYSCLYWPSHVARAKVDMLDGQLQKFLLGRKLLYWIEALSLLEKLGIALSGILELVEYFTADGKQGYHTLMNDIYRFILTFYDVICQSTPHLYISALAFAPEKSRISERMRRFFPRLLSVTRGAETGWTPCLRSIWASSEIFSVAVSPDSRRIVSGAMNGSICVWDAETGGLELKSLQSHAGSVNSVGLSPNGQRIVSGSDDKTIRVWDARTGDVVLGPLQGHSRRVQSVAFSPDGYRIVSCSDDGTVRIWDAESGDAVLEPLQCSGPASCVSFSPDSHRIVSGDILKLIHVWNAETGELVLDPLEGHSSCIFSVAFSHNGSRIVSGSADRTVRVWDAETGNAALEPLRGHSDLVVSVVFSHDDQLIASGSSDNTIRLWNAETGSLVSQLGGHSSAMTSVAFTHDDRRIVSGSADSTIRIWDIAGENRSRRDGFGFLEGHLGAVSSVALSPNGHHIASGSEDGTVRVWDVDTGDAVLEPLLGSSSQVWSVAFSPDGGHILSGFSDNTIRVWNAETGDAVSELLLGPMIHRMLSLAFSPDHRRVASGSLEGTVHIWDANTGKAVLGPLEGHLPAWRGWVEAVAFSHDGRHIVSGSKDHTVRVWDAETGNLVCEPLLGHTSEVKSLAFSHDNRRIASGSEDHTIRIWDAETGEPMLEPLRGHAYYVRSVAFSHDGRRIISGSFDCTIRVWDGETGDEALGPLKGHLGTVTCIALSHDDSRIVSGSSDSSVRIWDIKEYITSKSFSPNSLSETQTQSISQHLAGSGRIVTSTQLARYIDSAGWVTTTDGTPLLWLPPELRRVDDSSICISSTRQRRQTLIDLTHFVHGDLWTSVAGV